MKTWLVATNFELRMQETLKVTICAPVLQSQEGYVPLVATSTRSLKQSLKPGHVQSGVALPWSHCQQVRKETRVVFSAETLGTIG